MDVKGKLQQVWANKTFRLFVYAAIGLLVVGVVLNLACGGPPPAST